MKALKIGFVSREYPPFYGGGIGTYVHMMSLALRDLGHDVHIFTVVNGPRDKGVHFEGITIHRAAVPEVPASMAAGRSSAAHWLGLSVAFEKSVLTEHRKAPLDVLECPDYEAPGFALLTNPEWNAPTEVHFHTPSKLLSEANSQPPLEGEPVEAIQAALADSLCAPCRAMAAWAEGNFTFTKRVHVLAHPFYAEKFGREYRAPAGKQILYVGRLEKRKGVDTLIRGIPSVLRRVPDATFKLIGGDTATGPDGGSMKRHLLEILDPAAAKRVVFVDAIPPEELPRHLTESAFCVFPSVFENYPNVTMEAMSVGRTAVYSSNSGMLEMMDDTGLICPPNNPEMLAERIVELLNDPARAADLGRQAFMRVREIADPKRVAFAYEAHYREVAGIRRASTTEKLAQLPPGFSAESLQLLSAFGLSGFRSLLGKPMVSNTGRDRFLGVLENGRGKGWKKVVLFGAGKHTVRILSDFERVGRCRALIVAIADEAKEKWGTSIEGIPVISPEEAAASAPDAVVVSSDAFEKELAARARRHFSSSIEVKKIYGAD